MLNIREGKAFLSPGLNTNLERLTFYRADQRKDPTNNAALSGRLKLGANTGTTTVRGQ